jgi:hypothetical protein
MSQKENAMAEYLLLKHYRGAPAPVFIDGQALSPDGGMGPLRRRGRPPVTDGPFAETKDLIAGWMVIDVDSYARAIELAGELSAAPGAGGEAIHEGLEVRPFLAAPPIVTQCHG